MLSKNRNLVIAIVLIIAVAVLLVFKFSGESKSNFKGSLDKFDENLVNKIEIKLPNFENGIALVKNGTDWFLNIDSKDYHANNQKIKSIISELNGSRIKRVVATKESSWKKYSTDDSLGTKIDFFNDNKLLSSIIVGRFDYIQNADQKASQNYNQRPQGETVTYLRLPKSDVVYAINSMIPLQMGKTLNDYRDKSLLKVDKSEVNKINISKGKNSFILEKKNNSWYADDVKADSLKVMSYLNKLSNLQGNTFADKTPSLNEEDNIKFSFENGDQFVVRSINSNSDSAIISSTQFPENSFFDKNNSIYKKLFVNKDEFLVKK